MLLIFTSNANNSDEIKKEVVLGGCDRVPCCRCVSRMSSPMTPRLRIRHAARIDLSRIGSVRSIGGRTKRPIVARPTGEARQLSWDPRHRAIGAAAGGAKVDLADRYCCSSCHCCSARRRRLLSLHASRADSSGNAAARWIANSSPAPAAAPAAALALISSRPCPRSRPRPAPATHPASTSPFDGTW